MPRRRTTRNTSKRPGPTIPAGDEGTNVDEERRKEKVETLIKDFENEGGILNQFINVLIYLRTSLRVFAHIIGTAVC